MQQKNLFYKEFCTLHYILENARSILIVPHDSPDLDAVGSAVALSEFIQLNYAASTTIACHDILPESLNNIMPDIIFHHPDKIDLQTFDVIIGCDSIERGFHRIITGITDECVTVAIDHHHDISLTTDLQMIDSHYAATCEIIFRFIEHTKKPYSKKVATALLAGIIGDTGAFQHANTTAEILQMSADLIKKGASITKIMSTLYANRKIETLNLWGKALERTRYFSDTGLAVTAITEDGINNHEINSAEISNIASMLTTVPSIKAALIIYQAEKNLIKGSLRAEKYANIDVSAIAHTLGGGGHKLASGFSIPGRIESTTDGGWRVV